MVEVKKDTFKNASILQKRWGKFKGLKRSYYSLLILLTLYLISFFLPLFINNKALVVRYKDKYYFPVVTGYLAGKTFGQDVPGEARYRSLKMQFEQKS